MDELRVQHDSIKVGFFGGNKDKKQAAADKLNQAVYKYNGTLLFNTPNVYNMDSYDEVALKKGYPKCVLIKYNVKKGKYDVVTIDGRCIGTMNNKFLAKVGNNRILYGFFEFHYYRQNNNYLGIYVFEDITNFEQLQKYYQ